MVLLKGGSEALETNRTLAEIIHGAGVAAGMPDGWLNLLETRADVNTLLEMDQDVDLLIPRGSNEFVRYIMDHTRIPVLGHADGVCHLYLADDAEEQMAIEIAVDSKTQYVAVCNAVETILVDRTCADTLLLPLAEALKARASRFSAVKRPVAGLVASPSQTGIPSISITRCRLKSSIISRLRLNTSISMGPDTPKRSSQQTHTRHASSC